MGFGIVCGVKLPETPGTRGRATGLAWVAGCVVVGWVLTACGSSVPGHPSGPAGSATPEATKHVGADLAVLLPGQSQFPATYQAVVLPAPHTAQAAADLTGIPVGSTVDPADCVAPPPADPHQVAVVVGTDENTSATITVELSRSPEPLDRLRAQLGQCGTVRARHGALVTTVTTELDPPPPVNADDSLAWSRTAGGQRGGAGLTRFMRTLAAQVGDVRITATYLSFGHDAPDMEALDQVFTATVGDVRKG